MLVGVVALYYQHHTTRHNSHKHSQSHLASVSLKLAIGYVNVQIWSSYT